MRRGPLVAIVAGAWCATMWLGCDQVIGLSNPRVTSAEAGDARGAVEQSDGAPDVGDASDDGADGSDATPIEAAADSSSEGGSARDAPSGDASDGGGPIGEGGCLPTTCQQLGFDCGQAGDGCGGILMCGQCAPSQTCGGGGSPNHCGGGIPCVPVTCQDLGYTCGMPGDGCGGVLDCGTCDGGGMCSGGTCQ